MSFNPVRWPKSVTVGNLIEDGMQMEAHCHRCGRFVLLDPAGVGLPVKMVVPALEAHFHAGAAAPGNVGKAAPPQFRPIFSDASVAAAAACASALA